MNRIKIQLPEMFFFSTTMLVRINDLNYGGHVGNDTVLSIIQEARQQYLLSKGYEELNIDGLGLIMADVMVEYKKEINYADKLIISVAAMDFDKIGFDFYYKVEIENSGELMVAVKAKTGMILYDYQQKKKATFTEEMVSKIQ
jgi:acyl-CoA thioesterase FadM